MPENYRAMTRRHALQAFAVSVAGFTTIGCGGGDSTSVTTNASDQKHLLKVILTTTGQVMVVVGSHLAKGGDSTVRIVGVTLIVAGDTLIIAADIIDKTETAGLTLSGTQLKLLQDKDEVVVTFIMEKQESDSRWPLLNSSLVGITANQAILESKTAQDFVVVAETKIKMIRK